MGDLARGRTLVVGGTRSGRHLEDLGTATVPTEMAWRAWPLPGLEGGGDRNALAPVFMQRPSNGDPTSPVRSLESIDRLVSGCHTRERGGFDCPDLRDARAGDDDHSPRGSDCKRSSHRITDGIRVGL